MTALGHDYLAMNKNFLEMLSLRWLTVVCTPGQFISQEANCFSPLGVPICKTNRRPDFGKCRIGTEREKTRKSRHPGLPPCPAGSSPKRGLFPLTGMKKGNEVPAATRTMPWCQRYGVVGWGMKRSTSINAEGRQKSNLTRRKPNAQIVLRSVCTEFFSAVVQKRDEWHRITTENTCLPLEVCYARDSEVRRLQRVQSTVRHVA